MILEDEGRAICRYNEKEVLPNVEGIAVGTKDYRANRSEVYDYDIPHALRANLKEHVYMAHIQPPTEYWHGDLFDESYKDSDMFVVIENSDDEDENDVDENYDDDDVNYEDDDSN
ncbi:unnamed protein product [Lactuca saligna]|uniref:Uncharacterized protein n=1 Tax=Lactuca saligna TaxID=75948 RepID=A0AA35Y6V5_LACSI|nr:unnamed protein product [Lactuca saligna]